YRTKLQDRFGPLPKPATDLLNSIKVKWIASRLGIEKLVMKQGKMIAYFVSDQQSEYYQSAQFSKVLKFVQQHSSVGKMKEKSTPYGLRLLITFENVKSVRKALEIMQMF